MAIDAILPTLFIGPRTTELQPRCRLVRASHPFPMLWLLIQYCIKLVQSALILVSAYSTPAAEVSWHDHGPLGASSYFYRNQASPTLSPPRPAP